MSVKRQMGVRHPALPSRPLDELPVDHCTLRSKSFSFLPRKYRALVTLPPMRPHVAMVQRSTLKSKGSRGKKPPQDNGPVKGCYGDFCHAEFKYPQILQDIDSGTDAWTSTGRMLCQRHVEVDGETFDTLMKPEELAACLQEEEEDPSKDAQSSKVVKEKVVKVAEIKGGSLLDLPASQVLEARSHPGLCQWLESLDWRIDPENPSTLLAAAAHLATDEAATVPRNMAMRMDVSVPGMRYRLRPVKVCHTCFNTYQIINQIITLLRHQHRDRWAKSYLEKKKKQEEKEKERAQEAYINRVIGDEERMERCRSERCPPCLPRESLIFDHEVTQWMREIPDSPRTAHEMVKLMLMGQEKHSEEIVQGPPSSPEPNRRRKAVIN